MNGQQSSLQNGKEKEYFVPLCLPESGEGEPVGRAAEYLHEPGRSRTTIATLNFVKGLFGYDHWGTHGSKGILIL
jgi:hypothetical protein